MNKKTIIFIVASLYQPRCIKRIESFSENGYNCIVYGYTRGLYDVNTYTQSIEVHRLTQLKSGGHLIEKFYIIRQDISNIINKYSNQDVLFYAFGFIQAFILKLYHKKYIYEISDIAYAYPKYKYIEWLLKRIDIRTIKKSYLTIMTSLGFKEYFNLDDKNILIQPNKISPYFINYIRTLNDININHLVFGFVGAIRYESIFKFAEVIGEKFPQHQFSFYGGVSEATLQKCKKLVNTYSNIKYYGKFKSPEDLETIYKNLDVVVACYDVKSTNEKIAEPNKLYESIFFNKPIVVSQNTFLAKQVNKMKCGYAIDASSIDNIIAFIKTLKTDDLNQISQNEVSISSNDLIDNPYLIMNFLKEN